VEISTAISESAEAGNWVGTHYIMMAIDLHAFIAEKAIPKD
jgi:hypothetical protein